MKEIQLNFCAEAQTLLHGKAWLEQENHKTYAMMCEIACGAEAFSQQPDPRAGLPKAARELCTASPANIKPLCSIQVSWTRGSSLCRLELAWWREVDVETGVALRCLSETPAVVLVSCGGLCLVCVKPALCSAIVTKGCWAGAWGHGG